MIMVRGDAGAEHHHGVDRNQHGRRHHHRHQPSRITPPAAPVNTPMNINHARYEAMAKAGRLQPADPADPRIRATLDLDIQQQVTRTARRHLGFGARPGPSRWP